MNFIKNLAGNYGSPIITEEELIEQNLCPDCWGKQSYSDQFRQYANDQSVDHNFKESSQPKALFEKFVEKYVMGIKLQKIMDYLFCPSCKKKF